MRAIIWYLNRKLFLKESLIWKHEIPFPKHSVCYQYKVYCFSIWKANNDLQLWKLLDNAKCFLLFLRMCRWKTTISMQVIGQFKFAKLWEHQNFQHFRYIILNVWSRPYIFLIELTLIHGSPNLISFYSSTLLLGNKRGSIKYK